MLRLKLNHIIKGGPRWVKCLISNSCRFVYRYATALSPYKIMYEVEWHTVYALTRGLFWCLFVELWSNQGNTHNINTSVSIYIGHHKRTYIILFLIWHDESINDEKMTIYTHQPCVSLDRFTFCWCHQNQLLMMSQVYHTICDMCMGKACACVINLYH